MKTLLRPKMSSEKRPFLYNIETIPQEILTEILEHLDWQDVLRVRLACKRLHHASTAKSIWTGLIATHQYKVSPSFTFLDKPTKLHTSKELEQLFLRWKRVELSWLRSTPELKRSWLRTPQKSSLRDIHLLRGGRWLLCSNCDGDIWYYDLNVRDPDFFYLCQTPLPDDFITWNVMAVDEDWGSPILSFHLATCCGFRDHSWLDVWHGRLILDDRNQPVGLQVKRLARLPLSPDLRWPRSLSLFGDHVAYIEPVKHEIVIINWKNPGKEIHSTRKILLPDADLYDATLRLLPRDLLMCRGRYNTSIFDHSQIPESASKPDSDSSIQVAHISDHLHSCGLIPSSNPSQLVYCNGHGVYEYNPRPAAALGESKLEPSLLFKWPQSFRPRHIGSAHFSHNHGVLEDSDTFFFVRYSSPDERDGLPTGISQKSYRALGRSLSIQMSPYSGKIVCKDVARHLWLSDVLAKVEKDR